ncbi:MAG: M23 family metallopeptidase [Minwuia sp.]|nr:M23 family metallopeptidase [Minwuia sp.]
MRWLLVLLFAVVAILPARAQILNGELVQGGMVVGRTLPGTKVFLDGRSVRVSATGVFVIGFGRDHPPQARLRTVGEDGQANETLLEVRQRTYETQRINGLPPKMVTPPADVLKRIRRENAEIARIRSIDSPQTWFDEKWLWPAVGTVTGIYGSQRILNGKPRRPHYGIDIAAPRGTSVIAARDGIVRMAEEDLYYTGGTIMLDHGHGIVSVFSHLERIDVAVGDKVFAAQVIGAIGSTGRSTGPHLDWRVNWFDQRLDPALLLGATPVGG